ncbi:hypothetical protein [Lutispora thermophila]|uniref:hypothetical protein n=1 Tax=Lutispora thermophila TaxID=288966 RepID=UPI0015874517|nr:hypothetical protein [Lutispora thermophila]
MFLIRKSEYSVNLLTKQNKIDSLANSLAKMEDSIRNMMKAVVDESTNVSEMLLQAKK